MQEVGIFYIVAWRSTAASLPEMTGAAVLAGQWSRGHKILFVASVLTVIMVVASWEFTSSRRRDEAQPSSSHGGGSRVHDEHSSLRGTAAAEKSTGDADGEAKARVISVGTQGKGAASAQAETTPTQAPASRSAPKKRFRPSRPMPTVPTSAAAAAPTPEEREGGSDAINDASIAQPVYATENDEYWANFCTSEYGGAWCSEATRGPLIGGHENSCLAALDNAEDATVIKRYPTLIAPQPTAECRTSLLHSLSHVPIMGLGHLHGIHNYFLQFAAATGATFLEARAAGAIKAIGQDGKKYDAEPVLFHNLYSVPVSSGVDLCLRSHSWDLSQREERWMELNDRQVDPARAKAELDFFTFQQPHPFHVNFNVGVGRGAVNGNYEVTGPIYRTRWRRAVSLGSLDATIISQLSTMLLEEDRVARRAKLPTEFQKCTQQKSLLRVGIHIRRGDIEENEKYRDRFLPESYFANVLDGVLSLLPPCLLKSTYVSVFSASMSKAPALFDLVAGVAREHKVGYFHVWTPDQFPDESSIATLYALASQDIVIGSKSGFSHLASVYAPRAVHVSLNFTHPYEPHTRVVEVTDSETPSFDPVVFRSHLRSRLAERVNDCGMRSSAFVEAM